MNGVFVTGTDTDCGKTQVSLALMERLKQRGLTVLGMKPIASGCECTSEGLRNQDALHLQAGGSLERPYELINPYAFEPPIAPHIAAGRIGVEIERKVITTRAEQLAADADFLVVEGVGGWRVPLGPFLSVSDLPPALDLPVVLVSGIRLGCIRQPMKGASRSMSTASTTSSWSCPPAIS